MEEPISKRVAGRTTRSQAGLRSGRALTRRLGPILERMSLDSGLASRHGREGFRHDRRRARVLCDLASDFFPDSSRVSGAESDALARPGCDKGSGQ